MRKRIIKRTLVIEIIIVLSNYLKRKLSFFLYRTIPYWDFPIEETIYLEETHTRQNYNTSFRLFYIIIN